MSAAASHVADATVLQRRIDDLELQNEELRQALAPSDMNLPEGLQLTPAELRLMAVLIKRAVATHMAIDLALWGSLDHGRVAKNRAVRIMWLRRKLKPFGGVITSHERIGWSLDKASRGNWRGGAGNST